MARLKDMMPPGETVRWETVAHGSTMEIAVTDRHVLWAESPFRRDQGVVPLSEIRFVDLEEGGNLVNLHCDCAVHRMEEVGPGKLDELARAIGRPARIWRECRSPVTRRARRWQIYIAVGAAGLSAAGFIGLIYMAFGGDVLRGFDGAVAIAIAILPAHWFAGMAKNTLPHFLVGRRLSGEKRRDFVGYMTDPRWQGVKPDSPDDARLLRSRLGKWAMRVAYGEIPDIGEREPEVLIPGAFPGE